jgi:hypothetical protein
MDIIAGNGKRCRGLRDSFAIFFENKNGFVDVVAVVHRDIFIDGFRAPEFQGDVDNKKVREGSNDRKFGWAEDRGRRVGDKGMNSSENSRDDRAADGTETDRGSMLQSVNAVS